MWKVLPFGGPPRYLASHDRRRKALQCNPTEAGEYVMNQASKNTILIAADVQTPCASDEMWPPVGARTAT